MGRAVTSSSFLETCRTQRRSVSLNLVFVIPLLVLYEVGIRCTGAGLHNAAEVMLKDLRLFLGPWALRWFHWFLVAAATALFFRAVLRKGPWFSCYLAMLVESLLWALLLGPGLSLLVGGVFLDHPLTAGSGSDLSVRMLLSVGAGVYEELLFRLGILGGGFLLFVRLFRAPRGTALFLAVGISAFLFAAYHHLGPYGEPFTPFLFFFRLGAGVALGLLFMARGLGVAVYLHVFYDLIRDVEVTLHASGA